MGARRAWHTDLTDAPAQGRAAASHGGGAAAGARCVRAVVRPDGPARLTHRPDEAPAPEQDVDPTGGASRDDEDAVVATRSGRQVIESVLGGRVLEVIDETGERR